MRVRDRELTRSRLLKAGEAVVDETGLSGMSVAAVIERAAISKGGFFHHFSGREEFVLAIYNEFHDTMNADVTRAIEGIAPGRDRIIEGARAYWGFCLRRRATRAMLLDARGYAAIAEAARQREEESASTIVTDLKAIGTPDPGACAGLIVAAAREVAMREHERGKRVPAARRAFSRLVSRV